MKSLAAGLLGFAPLTCGYPVDAAFGDDLDEIVLPLPPIADCATDLRIRTRPSESPLVPAPELRFELDSDLRGGIEELHVTDPVCLYLLWDGTLMLRDSRGKKYYFRKRPKWDYNQYLNSPVVQ